MPEMQPPFSVYALTDYRVARLEGPDAKKFLQGQCTNDVDALKDGTAQLSAHCNHKGRMISSFYLSRETPDSFLLRIHESLADITLPALKKYLVFSKAELTLTQFEVFVLVSEEMKSTVAKLNEVPSFELNESHREIYVSNHSEKEQLLELAAAEFLPKSSWLSYQQKHGRIDLNSETTERFLPQELNYDCIDAVSFKKGCYTGQEIIARLHYRGQSKKRLYRGHTKAEAGVLGPNHTIIDTGSGKACGSVILAVESEENGCDFLAVVNRTSLDSDCVLELTNPLKIQWLGLPYAIP